MDHQQYVRPSVGNGLCDKMTIKVGSYCVCVSEPTRYGYVSYIGNSGVCHLKDGRGSVLIISSSSLMEIPEDEYIFRLMSTDDDT